MIERVLLYFLYSLLALVSLWAAWYEIHDFIWRRRIYKAKQVIGVKIAELEIEVAFSSRDGLMRTNEQCAQIAEKIGCYVVTASPNRLFIDIDTEEQFEGFNKLLPRLAQHFEYKDLIVAPSKSGLPHRHITITLTKNYPEAIRIGLQAVMGSDPMRELLSMKRSIEGQDNAVIFFEKKKKGRLINI